MGCSFEGNSGVGSAFFPAKLSSSGAMMSSVIGSAFLPAKLSSSRAMMSSNWPEEIDLI